MNDTAHKPSAEQSLRRHRINKSIEHLLGMVNGILADGHLHDKEILMLSTWLSANEEACTTWPMTVIARVVRETLQDGVITEAERENLQKTLNDLICNDFAETGSTDAAPTTLPIDHHAKINTEGRVLCLTGDFSYGTRAHCARLIEKLGGTVSENVSKKVHYLVVGSRSSNQWLHTSFGTKIIKAVECRDQGHAIYIVTEQQWLDAVEFETSKR